MCTGSLDHPALVCGSWGAVGDDQLMMMMKIIMMIIMRVRMVWWWVDQEWRVARGRGRKFINNLHRPYLILSVLHCTAALCSNTISVSYNAICLPEDEFHFDEPWKFITRISFDCFALYWLLYVEHYEVESMHLNYDCISVHSVSKKSQSAHWAGQSKPIIIGSISTK